MSPPVLPVTDATVPVLPSSLSRPLTTIWPVKVFAPASVVVVALWPPIAPRPPAPERTLLIVSVPVLFALTVRGKPPLARVFVPSVPMLNVAPLLTDIVCATPESVRFKLIALEATVEVMDVGDVAPVSVRALPPSVKPPAVMLMELKDLLVKSLLGVRRVVPVKTKSSVPFPMGATPPTQFRPVDQLSSAPSPFHVKLVAGVDRK